MSNIVGVRYIGSKQLKVDNVLNTGVSWVPGQVINFDAVSAATLAQHVGVWAITDVDHNAETKVVSTVKKSASDPRKFEPQTFANVNAMDKEQLHAFARTSLMRQLPDLETDNLREEVKSLLTLNFLDDQQGLSDAKKPKESLIISLHVSQEEFKAFESGSVVLKLVPKSKDAETFVQSDTYVVPKESSPIILAVGSGGSGGGGGDQDAPTREELDQAIAELPGDTTGAGVAISALRAHFGDLFTAEDEAKVSEAFKPAESTLTGNAATDSTGTPSAAPTSTTTSTPADPEAELKANLELLEVKDLRDMVKKAGLPVSNTMKKEVLIAKLLAASFPKAD